MKDMHQIIFQGRKIIPSKIVCVGRNYVAHIKELGNDVPEEMVIFVKPNSSMSDELHATHAGEQLHYEGELCFLVQQGRFSAIGFGLDLTKRGSQNDLKARGLPWERAKGFDGASVFSEFVKIPESLEALEFELLINGKKIQSGDINLMIHKPLDILKEINSFMALNEDDIVMTGTPEGVGRINKGDIFEAKIINSSEIIVNAKWCAI
jgi:2-keto-4-pentenoate hydratase/2-oxohepta-3-ene-1,7-dioic acid hydratase in catechol pathway